MSKELGKRSKTRSVYIGDNHMQKLEVISAKISGGSLYPMKPSQVIQWVVDNMSNVVIDTMISRIKEKKQAIERNQ